MRRACIVQHVAMRPRTRVWLAEAKRNTSSGARSTTGGEDLLHPPLRAAEARGDEERAETGSTRFGDELLVDGARHEPQNSEKQKSAARHGQTF